MNHFPCENLDDFLGGWLDARSRREFEEHLAQCSSCAEEVRLQRRIDALLAQASPASPDHLAREIVAAIRQRRFRSWVSFAAAASVLLGSLLAGWRFSTTGAPNLTPGRNDRTQAALSNQEAPAGGDAVASTRLDGAPTELPRESDPTTQELVSVDAGSDVIVLPERSGDPRVHIFWLYPTVDVARADVNPTPNSLQSERNPL